MQNHFYNITFFLIFYSILIFIIKFKIFKDDDDDDFY